MKKITIDISYQIHIPAILKYRVNLDIPQDIDPQEYTQQISNEELKSHILFSNPNILDHNAVKIDWHQMIPFIQSPTIQQGEITSKSLLCVNHEVTTDFQKKSFKSFKQIMIFCLNMRNIF